MPQSALMKMRLGSMLGNAEKRGNTGENPDDENQGGESCDCPVARPLYAGSTEPVAAAQASPKRMAIGKARKLAVAAV